MKKGYKTLVLKAKDFLQKIINYNSVEMTKDKILFVMDTSPRQKALYLNGQYIDKTPLEKWFQVSQKKYTLEIDGGASHLGFLKTLNSDPEAYFFISDTRITLNSSYLQKAREYFFKDNIRKTISVLSSIPERHPEYFASQDFLAKVYFDTLKQYEESFKIYKTLLSFSKNNNLSSSIKDILNYNASLSLLLQAEKLHKKRDSALALKQYKHTHNFMIAIEQKSHMLENNSLKNSFAFFKQFTKKRLLQYTEDNQEKVNEDWIIFFKANNNKKNIDRKLISYNRGVLERLEKVL